MKVIISAGGLGTRLRPFTFSIPKPLLPIGEHAIIEVCLKWLKHSGVTEVGISLGWRGEYIQSFLGDGEKYGLSITYVQEKERRGTAGHLLGFKDFIGDGPVFMMNGDIITKLNINKMMQFHIETSSPLTVATKVHKTQSSFGVLSLVNTSIVGLSEKPTYREIISCGMYAINKECLDFIPKNRKYDMTELILDLIKRFPITPNSYNIDEDWVAVEQVHELEALAESREWKEWIQTLTRG